MTDLKNILSSYGMCKNAMMFVHEGFVSIKTCKIIEGVKHVKTFWSVLSIQT